MGNGRSPCCDKNLVKRGPWSPAEDLKLITFIQKYGHDNWRALPRQAGLMRCGKSCRLRWVNYLRPDVKRGDYSQEELETIMKLHEALGNKWSMIASHLPGRTDNEIKNLWNTHLKKRLACKKTSESASDMQEFQGATIKEPEQNLVKQGSNELVGIIKNPNQSSSSADAVSSVQLNNFNASHMDAYKPDQQMSSSLFKHFEPYNVDKPSEEANQLNSLVVKTPFEADCDFWKILDNIPIKLNEVQLGQDHDIHNQTLRQENVHYAETIKCLHGMENEFGFDATNEANKDQCLHKNIASTESGIDPHSFGYDEMTMPEFDYDIDLGYVQWYSSWPQNPSL